MRKLVGDKLDLPYDHYLELFSDEKLCTFPPRITVYADVSRLVKLEGEKVWFPVVHISLYFDKEGRPVAHVYKRFSVVWGGRAEEVFKQELLQALREAAHDSRITVRTSTSFHFGTEDKVVIEAWLHGEEEVIETRRYARDIALAVLYAVQRCPWVVAARELMLALESLMLLQLREQGHDIDYRLEEPDSDILLKIDLDKLSEHAKIIIELLKERVKV